MKRKIYIIFILILATSCRLFHMEPLSIQDVQPKEGEILRDIGESKIRVLFSAEPDHTKAEESFSFSQDGTDIEGIFSWEDEKRLVFTPFIPFEYGKEYQYTIKNSVEDSWGNSLSDTLLVHFSTKNESTRPKIESISPGKEERTGGQLSPIVITFSEPVSEESALKAVTLSPTSELCREFSNDGKTYTMTPIKPLDYQSEYRIRVSTELKNLSENSLAAEWNSRFWVSQDVDPPSLISAGMVSEGIDLEAVPCPADDYKIDSNWSQSWPLSLIFSEPVDTKSVEARFTTEPALNPKWSWSEDKTTATLLFDPQMSYETEYDINLSEGWKDLCQNEAEEKSHFRVLTDREDEAPPKISRVLFLSDPDGTDTVELESLDALDLEKYPLETEKSGFFDLYTTQTINPYSLMEAMQFSPTNNCVEIKLLRIETSGFEDPQPGPEADEQPIRVHCRIKRKGNSGTIRITISETLKSSSGISMAKPVTFYLTK